jgi:hypothetical protein
MSKYHAAAKGTKPGQGSSVSGFPLCGNRGSDRDKTVTVAASEWNQLRPEQRCQHCVEAIKRMKAAQ